MNRISSKLANGKRIAIIGSGPAGMHAALLLAQQGFAVELFEKEKQLGGILRYCIPKFRFGRQGIDKKIEKLRELGVKIHAGKAVGNKQPLQEIAESFDAVLLACGEQKEERLGLQGEGLKGVIYWSVFLREYNEGRAKKLDGKKALVLGGGDTAIDCARVAARQGAEAFLAYRRSREGMPAEKREIEAAEKEGVQFRFHLSPVEFKGNSEGRLAAIVFEKTTGQGREMRSTGEFAEEKADVAIIAAGQQPDLGFLQGSNWKSLAELPAKIVLAGDLANREKRIAAAISSAEKAVKKIKELVN